MHPQLDNDHVFGRDITQGSGDARRVNDHVFGRDITQGSGDARRVNDHVFGRDITQGSGDARRVISPEDCVSSPSTYLAVLIRSRGKGGEADSRSMITDQLLPLLRLICNPVDQHPRRGPWSPKWKCPCRASSAVAPMHRSQLLTELPIE